MCVSRRLPKMGNAYLRKQVALAGALRLIGNKNKTVATDKGLTGTLYKQGTTKDTANFDQTNDTMAEYANFTVGPVALKMVRTLTRYGGTIREKPTQKYRLVTVAVVAGGLPTVTEISNRYTMANRKMTWWWTQRSGVSQ